MTRRTLLLGTSVVVGPLTLLTERASPQVRPAETEIFTFQNSFWVNLHLFVRAEARALNRGTRRELFDSALTLGERAPWKAALDAYRELGRASLIFDKRLVRINNGLATVRNTTEVPPDAVESPIATVLNGAAPVYRAHLWDHHREENKRWISAYAPEVQQQAAGLMRALAQAFPVDWPASPLLVDLSRYTGPSLAFTTEGPDGTAGHTVVAPQKNPDKATALDTIFHEISHTIDDQFIQMVGDEAERQGVQIPPTLWHAITAYTTGKIVERELDRQGVGHRLDVERAKRFEANDWQRISTALERHWKPYLDGTTPLPNALREVVLDAAQ